MNKKLLPVMFGFTLTVSVAAMAQVAGGPREIHYPGEFATLQEAIDAVPERGILRIDSGIFEQTEPRSIDRFITIVGEGCPKPDEGDGQPGEPGGTTLLWPLPDDFTPADEVVGGMSYVNAVGGVIRDIELVGSDTAIWSFPVFVPPELSVKSTYLVSDRAHITKL